MLDPIRSPRISDLLDQSLSWMPAEYAEHAEREDLTRIQPPSLDWVWLAIETLSACDGCGLTD